MRNINIAQKTQARQEKQSTEKSLDEQIYYVTHQVHNRKQADGRINRFDPTTGVYAANSVSPFAENFLELNVEEGVKPLVQALIQKGYFTYSSCAGHCLTDRRFVGIAFQNEISKIRFLNQMRFLESHSVVFKELESVINQKSDLSGHDMKSTPLGESGQQFVSTSEETSVFNIQFHSDSLRYHFVEMILLEGNDTCNLMNSPVRAIKLLLRRLFYKDENMWMATDFVMNKLIP